MKFLKIIPLAIFALAALTPPTFADDYDQHDWDRHRHDHNWDHHRHDHDRRYWDHDHWCYGPQVNVGVGFYSGPYYGGGVVYGHGSVGIDVQQALARRGYYGGVIDGDIGPQTRSAIRSYQLDRGLPVSGHIDRPLLRSLHLL